MAGKTQICNMALAKIHSTRRIANIDDDTNEARQCKLHYDQAREYVLEEHAWTFATARKLLTASTETPPLEWAYAYTVPPRSDMLRANSIANGLKLGRREQEIPYTIENTDGVRTLYTDQPDACLVYTLNVTDEPLFTAMFVEALTWRLAELLAMPITGNPEMEQAAARTYVYIKGQAIASDRNSLTTPQEPDNDILAARL